MGLYINNETNQLVSVILGIADDMIENQSIDKCIDPKTKENILNNTFPSQEDCIKEIEGSNRVGVKKVMEVFNTWCKKNSVREYKKLKDFRENFEKITGLKRSKTNIRGYKIELKL